MGKIKFCGAAGTVTGSCTLVQTDAVTFLVDCGLFQGNRTTQELNWGEFPFDASEIEFLVLTHAHIDHSGLLPKLTRAGFKGKIHTTEPTSDLLQFMLPDSAFIQESNAERQTKKNARRGLEPVEPIYTIEHTKLTLAQLQSHRYEQWIDLPGGVRARFWNAGHLLGSMSAEMEVPDGDTTLRMLFSGDLGPQEKAFHPPPSGPSGYDYVICESTYGGRDREEYTLEARREAIRRELKLGLSRGGNVVIPSFAVERSQELLHDIAVVLDEGELDGATVYLDSPLARKATEVFIKYASELEDIEVDPEKLFRHERFRLIQSVEESKQLNDVQKGAIIISASGMCTAGRIKHHLKANIHRPESTILFVGYQAPGTLGQIITSGADAVRIHGKEYMVRADIRRIGNYSAHADAPELIQWVKNRLPIRGALFLNHGEDDSRQAMKTDVEKIGLGDASIYMPQFDQTYQISAKESLAETPPTPRVEIDQITDDWANEYARFILQLGEKMRSIEDPKQRRDVIERLENELAG